MTTAPAALDITTDKVLSASPQNTDSTLKKIKTKTRRGSPSGIIISKLILSAFQGLSEDVFPQILDLHVSIGSIVADLT